MGFNAIFYLDRLSIHDLSFLFPYFLFIFVEYRSYQFHTEHCFSFFHDPWWNGTLVSPVSSIQDFQCCHVAFCSFILSRTDWNSKFSLTSSILKHHVENYTPQFSWQLNFKCLFFKYTSSGDSIFHWHTFKSARPWHYRTSDVSPSAFT